MVDDRPPGAAPTLSHRVLVLLRVLLHCPASAALLLRFLLVPPLRSLLVFDLLFVPPFRPGPTSSPLLAHRCGCCCSSRRPPSSKTSSSRASSASTLRPRRRMRWATPSASFLPPHSQPRAVPCRLIRRWATCSASRTPTKSPRPSAADTRPARMYTPRCWLACPRAARTRMRAAARGSGPFAATRGAR